MATVEREVEFPAQGEISALVGDKIKAIMEDRPQRVAITAVSGDFDSLGGEFHIGDRIGLKVQAILAEYHSEVPDSTADFDLESYELKASDTCSAKIYMEASDE